MTHTAVFYCEGGRGDDRSVILQFQRDWEEFSEGCSDLFLFCFFCIRFVVDLFAILSLSPQEIED